MIVCIGDEIQYFFQVQLCGFRWGQIGGDEDDFILNCIQIDDCQIKDVVQQVFIDIMYVSCMFFQVFIIQFFQGSGLIVDNFIGCCVGSYVFIFNQGYDFLFKFFIFQQYNMFFEDGFFFFIESFISFGFDDFQLGGGFGVVVQEMFDFLINFIGRNFFLVDDNFIFFQQ